MRFALGPLRPPSPLRHPAPFERPPKLLSREVGPLRMLLRPIPSAAEMQILGLYPARPSLALRWAHPSLVPLPPQRLWHKSSVTARMKVLTVDRALRPIIITLHLPFPPSLPNISPPVISLHIQQIQSHTTRMHLSKILAFPLPHRHLPNLQIVTCRIMQAKNHLMSPVVCLRLPIAPRLELPRTAESSHLQSPQRTDKLIHWSQLLRS